MSKRVELLPQSKAARASGTNVVDHERPGVDRTSDKLTHGIGVTREVVGEMRVEALDTDARSPDAAVRLNKIGAYGCQRASPCVVVVSLLQLFGVDELFEAMHAPFALESTDGVVQIGVNQPVQGRHRGAVAQVGFVLDDDGTSVVRANHDRETPAKGATYERCDMLLIVKGRVVKRQRQNSRVRERRERKPGWWPAFTCGVDPVRGAASDGATSG